MVHIPAFLQTPASLAAVAPAMRDMYDTLRHALEDLPILSGVGNPEGVVAAAVGTLFLRSDGGANTTLYVKEGGAETTTGWVAK